MIPTSIFKEELQQFHMLRDIGQHCAIDAGWLSHLTAVLWYVSANVAHQLPAVIS